MAGRASLTFLGQDDIVLTGSPEITYFIERYPGQTLFASRIEKVLFNQDSVSFGDENYVVLPRAGDLITHIYLKIESPPELFSVLDSAGTLMISTIELYIGSECIERLYGEHIEIKNDIEIPLGKQPALSRCTGKNLVFSQIVNSIYTIPLPFSICTKGIPLCAFREDVSIRVTWNPSSVFTYPPVYIQEFNSYLHVEYTYLDRPETLFIQSTERIMVIEQVQRNSFFIPYGMNTYQCALDFYNPVKELFFVIQNDLARGYDYTLTASQYLTFGSGDQLQSLELNFNTTDRISFAVGTPLFLRVIQALEFHTRVPDRNFYMYSFSLDPENSQPCGAANFTPIKNQILNLNLNTSLTNRNLRVYAVNYNFFSTSNGAAHMIFSNFK